LCKKRPQEIPETWGREQEKICDEMKLTMKN